MVDLHTSELALKLLGLTTGSETSQLWNHVIHMEVIGVLWRLKMHWNFLARTARQSDEGLKIIGIEACGECIAN